MAGLLKATNFPVGNSILDSLSAWVQAFRLNHNRLKAKIIKDKKNAILQT